MLYPTDLKYSKSHEWVKMEDGVAVIGISDFAQDALGDVVFVNLPGEGDDVREGRVRPGVPRHRPRVRRQRGAAGPA